MLRTELGSCVKEQQPLLSTEPSLQPLQGPLNPFHCGSFFCVSLLSSVLPVCICVVKPHQVRELEMFLAALPPCLQEHGGWGPRLAPSCLSQVLPHSELWERIKGYPQFQNLPRQPLYATFLLSTLGMTERLLCVPSDRNNYI